MKGEGQTTRAPRSCRWQSWPAALRHLAAPQAENGGFAAVRHAAIIVQQKGMGVLGCHTPGLYPLAFSAKIHSRTFASSTGSGSAPDPSTTP